MLHAFMASNQIFLPGADPSAPGDWLGADCLVVCDCELLHAAGGGGADVVGIAAVADQPAPCALCACKEGGVGGAVSAVPADVDCLREGRCSRARGIAWIVEVER